MMDTEIIKTLLRNYTGCDFDRPALLNPFTIDWNNKKWSCATDAQKLIIIPQDDNYQPAEPDTKPPNVVAIIPEFDLEITIKSDDLINLYNSIPIVRVEIIEECPACDGDGKFEHYGDYYDCKNCDETGEIKTGRFEDVSNPDVYIRLGVAVFRNKLIKHIINTIKFTKSNSFIIRRSAKLSINILELDNGIFIGIMPVDTEDLILEKIIGLS